MKYTVKEQRKNFHQWLKNNKNEFEIYIGISLIEFKNYIEKKFQLNMSWENHGKTTWHLDHIIPLASFDLTNEEEVKKAWHYTNFQPLEAKENLSKGYKIIKV